MLKKLIRLNLDDMGLALGVVGGFFLLIHLVTAVVLCLFDHGNSSLLLSGVVLPIVSAIVILMIAWGHTLSTFTMAVKFSQTRRRSLGLTLGLVGFEAACSMGLAALLNLLERAAAPRFWMWLTSTQYLTMGTDVPLSPEPGTGAPVNPARELTLFIEDFSLPWWWFPLLAVGAVVLGLIMGAIILRFGRRGGWVLWGLWMAVCFLPQLLPWEAHWFTLPWQYLAAAGGIFVLACLGWSVWYLLRAPIKT